MIDDVVKNVRELFLNDGVDEQVLSDLREVCVLLYSCVCLCATVFECTYVCTVCIDACTYMYVCVCMFVMFNEFVVCVSCLYTVYVEIFAVCIFHGQAIDQAFRV